MLDWLHTHGFCTLPTFALLRLHTLRTRLHAFAALPFGLRLAFSVCVRVYGYVCAFAFTRFYTRCPRLPLPLYTHVTLRLHDRSLPRLHGCRAASLRARFTDLRCRLLHPVAAHTRVVRCALRYVISLHLLRVQISSLVVTLQLLRYGATILYVRCTHLSLSLIFVLHVLYYTLRYILLPPYVVILILITLPHCGVTRCTHTLHFYTLCCDLWYLGLISFSFSLSPYLPGFSLYYQLLAAIINNIGSFTVARLRISFGFAVTHFAVAARLVYAYTFTAVYRLPLYAPLLVAVRAVTAVYCAHTRILSLIGCYTHVRTATRSRRGLPHALRTRARSYGCGFCRCARTRLNIFAVTTPHTVPRASLCRLRRTHWLVTPHATLPHADIAPPGYVYYVGFGWVAGTLRTPHVADVTHADFTHADLGCAFARLHFGCAVCRILRFVRLFVRAVGLPGFWPFTTVTRLSHMVRFAASFPHVRFTVVIGFLRLLRLLRCTLCARVILPHRTRLVALHTFCVLSRHLGYRADLRYPAPHTHTAFTRGFVTFYRLRLPRCVWLDGYRFVRLIFVTLRCVTLRLYAAFAGFLPDLHVYAFCLRFYTFGCTHTFAHMRTFTPTPHTRFAHAHAHTRITFLPRWIVYARFTFAFTHRLRCGVSLVLDLRCVYAHTLRLDRCAFIWRTHSFFVYHHFAFVATWIVYAAALAHRARTFGSLVLRRLPFARLPRTHAISFCCTFARSLYHRSHTHISHGYLSGFYRARYARTLLRVYSCVTLRCVYIARCACVRSGFSRTLSLSVCTFWIAFVARSSLSVYTPLRFLVLRSRCCARVLHARCCSTFCAHVFARLRSLVCGCAVATRLHTHAFTRTRAFCSRSYHSISGWTHSLGYAHVYAFAYVWLRLRCICYAFRLRSAPLRATHHPTHTFHRAYAAHVGRLHVTRTFCLRCTPRYASRFTFARSLRLRCHVARLHTLRSLSSHMDLDRCVVHTFPRCALRCALRTLRCRYVYAFTFARLRADFADLSAAHHRLARLTFAVYGLPRTAVCGYALPHTLPHADLVARGYARTATRFTLFCASPLSFATRLRTHTTHHTALLRLHTFTRLDFILSSLWTVCYGYVPRLVCRVRVLWLFPFTRCRTRIRGCAHARHTRLRCAHLHTRLRLRLPHARLRIIGSCLNSCCASFALRVYIAARCTHTRTRMAFSSLRVCTWIALPLRIRCYVYVCYAHVRVALRSRCGAFTLPRLRVCCVFTFAAFRLSLRARARARTDLVTPHGLQVYLHTRCWVPPLRFGSLHIYHTHVTAVLTTVYNCWLLHTHRTRFLHARLRVCRCRCTYTIRCRSCPCLYRTVGFWLLHALVTTTHAAHGCAHAHLPLHVCRVPHALRLPRCRLHIVVTDFAARVADCGCRTHRIYVYARLRCRLRSFMVSLRIFAFLRLHTPHFARYTRLRGCCDFPHYAAALHLLPLRLWLVRLNLSRLYGYRYTHHTHAHRTLRICTLPHTRPSPGLPHALPFACVTALFDFAALRLRIAYVCCARTARCVYYARTFARYGLSH